MVQAGVREGVGGEAGDEHHGAAQLTFLAHLGPLRRWPALCCFSRPALYQHLADVYHLVVVVA